MRRLLLSTFVFFLIVSIEEPAISVFKVHVDPPGLPDEVLTCPVYIRGDDSDGTAFFMFHNDYGYLITARHLLYRFSKILSEIPKVGISDCRKKRSFIGTFFDERYNNIMDMVGVLSNTS